MAPADPSTQRPLFRSIWVFGVVLAVFCMVTGYTLLRLYRTSSLLAEARSESLLMEAQSKAESLDEYLDQRIVDAQNPAIERYLEAYYRGKALGMSPEYGLNVSLNALTEELNRFKISIRDHGRLVFRNIAYYDREQGRIFAGTEKTEQPETLDPDVIQRIQCGKDDAVSLCRLCANDHCRLFVSREFAYKGQPKGTLLMELALKTIEEKIRITGIQEDSDFTGIVDSGGVLIVGPANLAGKTLRELFGVPHIYFTNFEIVEAPVGSGGGVKDSLIVKGSGRLNGGVRLVTVVPKSRYLAGHSPFLWTMLSITLMVGLLLMLYHLFSLFRERHRMYQQLEESHDRLEKRVEERTTELAQINAELRRQMLDRERAENALTKSEERYRDLVENATDIIFMTDSQGRFTFVNTVAVRTTGFSEKEIVGKHFTEFVEVDHRPQTREFFQRQALAGTPVSYLEFPSITKSGETIWLGQKTQLLKEDSKVVGFQSIARDITARREVEAELRDAKEAAEAGNRAKTEFLARMSHEIRTPINAIVGYTELLLDDELSEEQREALETVKLSTNTLLTLIDDILDLSKVEADKLSLEQVPFNVESLVVDACELVRGRVGDKPVEILCDIQDTPEYLIGDPVRIKQILMNLLINAIKFTERGEIIASVRCLEVTGQKVNLQIDVQDQGIGVPEHMLDAIFDPFTQAHNSVAYEHGGAGLGLAICRRLVRLMGGDISVSSRAGEGSLFRFNAWLATVPTGSEEVPVPLPLEDLAGKRALLLDDSPTALRILEETLSRAGIESVSAITASHAFQELEKTLFDFAVVDIRMPQMSGYEFARQVSTVWSHHCPKIIALSSEPQWRDKQRLAEAGFDGFLMKPTRRPVMFTMIRTVLGLSGKAEKPMTQHLLKIPRPKVPRVLLAEDNPVNQRMTMRMLTKMGIEVELAENGFKAVEKAKSQTYDLILMDVQMPVMDGLAATRELRRRGVTAPVVALTAAAMKGDKELGVAAGMNDYVAKPIKHQSMREILQRFCGIEGIVDYPDRLRILVADDDASASREMVERLQEFLPAATTVTAGDGVQACAKLGSLLPHLVILNLSFPQLSVRDVIKFMASDRRYSTTRVVITGLAEDLEARAPELRELGVTQFLSKPLVAHELLSTIQELFSNVGMLRHAAAAAVSPGESNCPASRQSRSGEESDPRLHIRRTPSSSNQGERVPETVCLETFVALAAQQLGMSEEEYRDVAEEFVQDVRARLDRLEMALSDKDGELTRQVAHAIKGGASEMLLADMAASAARIEFRAKKGVLGDCRGDLAALHKALETFEKILSGSRSNGTNGT
jgi:two-component system, sensor histidine kinase and response regulator